MKTLITALLFLSLSALAVDNPEAPDLVGEFNSRAKSFEDKLSKAGGGGAELTKANSEYQKFLDAELNKAYSALNQKLSEASKTKLRESQKKWLAFRDSEFEFIGENWTIEQFGTSSRLSVANHRASLVKERVLTLLRYQR